MRRRRIRGCTLLQHFAISRQTFDRKYAMHIARVLWGPIFSVAFKVIPIGKAEIGRWRYMKTVRAFLLPCGGRQGDHYAWRDGEVRPTIL